MKTGVWIGFGLVLGGVHLTLATHHWPGTWGGGVAMVAATLGLVTRDIQQHSESRLLLIFRPIVCLSVSAVSLVMGYILNHHPTVGPLHLAAVLIASMFFSLACFLLLFVAARRWQRKAFPPSPSTADHSHFPPP